MSIYELRSLSCGACGESRTVKVADSANPLRHPPFLDDLLDRTFNRFACPGCGHVDVLEEPMLWTDVTHGLVAAMLPRSSRPGWAGLEVAVAEGLAGPVRDEGPQFVRDWGRGARIRVVFGLDELREKVVAARAGIDDRAVEVCKLPFVDHSEAAGPDLDSVDDDGLHLVFGAVRSTVPWTTYFAAVDALDGPGDIDPALAGLAQGAWVHWLRASLSPLGA